jgi:chromosome segregation protein
MGCPEVFFGVFQKNARGASIILAANDKLRLSHIKLAGFKSFIDSTEISLPGALVGVVGPNGCGKSNVIDAVRWVLGESRASALRGESMQDVIFNGSANRAPVGRASVELIFDNSLGKAVGQWSNYAEISIKRILRRDGESTYHINNIHVRRKDVADIFLGTGIGGRGYAIIEQGMIARIIEAKPEELRVFLEEAAGVSKYRERRRETELRLADTRENLLRLNDICRELEKQLSQLEEQARVARQFNEAKAQLRAAQNLLWYARKQEAAARRVLAEEELQSLQANLELEAATLRRTEKYLEEKRARHYAISDTVHQAQGDLYAANAQVAQVEQQIRHLRDNQQRVAQQSGEAKTRLEQHEKQAADAADGLHRKLAELQCATETREASARKAAVENEKLPLADTAARLHQDRVIEIQRNLLLVEQAGKLEESHRDHAEKNFRHLETRRTRLLREREALAQPEAEALSRSHREAEGIAADLEQKRRILAHTESRLRDAEEVRHELVRDVQTIEQRIVEAEARLSVLQRLQARLEGSEGLSDWLGRHRLHALPRLWQSLQITDGWEDALEAVLRERLNSTQLERLEAAHDWLSDPPPGKWALFESFDSAANLAAEEAQDGKTEETVEVKEGEKLPLQRYVACNSQAIRPVLQEWLNSVFIADDIPEALSQRASLALGEMLVTRRGHVVTRHSLTYYAPDSQLHGVLARQREITQTETEIHPLREGLAGEKSSLETAEEDCRELESSISRLRHDVDELQALHHDVQMQILKLTQLNERTAQRCRQIDAELAEIAQQAEAEALRKSHSEKKRGEHEQQIERLREHLRKETREAETAEHLLREQRQLVESSRKEMQEAVFHERACENNIVELENAVRRIEENRVTLQAHLERLQAEQEVFDDTPLYGMLKEWLAHREQREGRLGELRDAQEALGNELREIERERMASEQKLHPLREAINTVRLKQQEAQITENQFGEQLKESGVNDEELLPILGKTRPSTLQAEINRLNLEIAGLGAVNLGALEQLQACKTRKTYLDSQAQDLNEASETLKNAIRRIDSETRERLLATVHGVNDHLSELFPAIFGGGQARLVLNGEEILDSGVQIIAQPPGKKNSSIHLLSGGEKALTALALVFSLFRLNPAPFCLLDEVDAPLDDSNTERFCNLVRKMSHYTQFVFITHNKITMEMAQHLVGITMQEKGVSRVVAVEIEEIVRPNVVLEF